MFTIEPSSTERESLLPPPYSYEELYSSYQNEWDCQKKSNRSDRTTNVGNCDDTTGIDIDIDIDESVSDLKWVTVPKHSDPKHENEKNNADEIISENENETYLLACSGSGEVVVWKLGQTTTKTTQSINPMDAATSNNSAAVALVRHTRWSISRSDNDAEDRKGDTDDSGDDGHAYGSECGALSKMCIVSATFPDGASTSGGRNRKRQRQDQSGGQEDAMEDQQLLIIAGEDGLWSVPLSEVLQKQPMQGHSASSVVYPPSLLRLSDRAFSQLQCLSPTSKSPVEAGNNVHSRLFALEKNTNNLLVWDARRIIQCHNNNNNKNDEVVPDNEIDLSRCFSEQPVEKPKKRRRLYQKSIVSGECATTILVSKSHNQFNLLVGTDRSRVWILSIASDAANLTVSIKRLEPRFLSLNVGKKASTTKSSSAYVSNHHSRKKGSLGLPANERNQEATWKVTDLAASSDGTWWTASAVKTGKTKNNSDSDGTSGLIVTWHASSGMVTARRETREAIHAIRLEQEQPPPHGADGIGCSSTLLYSAGNEAAVSAWDSSFSLDLTGRFWASPPSSKAIAVAFGTTTMAVGGVGNRVDLFFERCRVQTVRL
ncbi:unnamed protein product [Pseudo-nitzschia multistriata]|uniref:Uncharacterized protein n=1 Tax=Pseudo-nitzschia multistriata TaxID=183589 RepID=A0A448YYD6_9STRA|nr:unnamed protein product [Pseudo-nitzschia multistriata]